MGRYEKIILFVLLCMTPSFCYAEKKTKENIVKIETNYGNLKVILYDDTPLHRDNFLTLAQNGFYEGTLFHRVIPKFMVQGGDPDSRNAAPDKHLGIGGSGYTVPSEIIFPQHYHKRGALAAARTGDNINPERASSGSQFYIVQGTTFDDEQIDGFENEISFKLQQSLFKQLMDKNREAINTLQAEGDKQKAEEMKKSSYDNAQRAVSEMKPFKYTEEQRRTYKMFGGTPHLDTQYTVFGELIDGYSVLDSISKVKTSTGNRPVNDVVILKMKIVKK